MLKKLFFLTIVTIPAYSTQLINRLDPSTVILESKKGNITMGDLSNVGMTLDRFEDNLFDFYHKNAEQKLLEKILEKKADAKKMDIQAYLKSLDDKVKVSSSDIKKYKAEKKESLSVFDPVKKESRLMNDEEISNRLLSEKKSEARKKLFDDLLAEAGVKKILDRDPIVVPVTESTPQKGSTSKSAVVLHVFSDFQCPYCSKVAPEIQKLLDKHGRKLRVYFHNFPLSFHSWAKPAAIAASCAQKQSKFWEFHDAFFAKDYSFSKNSFSDLAKKFRLNSEKFESCRQDAGVAQQIDEELLALQKIGIQSTPSFIIGGRRIAGYKTLTELELLTGLN